MGQPAARIGDMHVCPLVNGTVPHVGGPVLPACAPTVLSGKIPQARVTDMCTCVGPPDMIAKGSTGVLVTKLPAARLGDTTIHGGSIVIGLPTVLIGETGNASVGGGGNTPPGAMGSGQAGSGPGEAAAAAAIGELPEGPYSPLAALTRAEALHVAQARALEQGARENAAFCELCRQ